MVVHKQNVWHSTSTISIYNYVCASLMIQTLFADYKLSSVRLLVFISSARVESLMSHKTWTRVAQVIGCCHFLLTIPGGFLC